MLSEEIRAAHAQLSDASLRFVEHAIREPGCARKLFPRSADMPAWGRPYIFDLQSWPTFLGRENLKRLERASIGLANLVRQIPTRFLGGDPKRVRDFYGLADELRAATLLQPPNGIAGCIGRLDFIHGPGGFKCLELNMASNLGGWQVRYIEPLLRQDPPIARFLSRETTAPVYRDSLRLLLSHLVRDAMRQLDLRERRLNLGMVLPQSAPFPRTALADMKVLYQTLLDEIGGGWTGDILACHYQGAISVRQGKVHAGNERLHVLLEYTTEQTPGDVYTCFKQGAVALYNGPITRLFCTKRNLVFLSQLEDSDELSAEERSLLRDHLPWSRDVVPGETTHRGEVVSLLDHLLAHRGEFIIKPARELGGRGVCVGRFASQDDWERHVRAAVAAGKGWLVQEYVRGYPYLYQHGEEGYGPHDAVWGAFCFGSSTYGGTFVRVLPRDTGGGVVNSTQGAAEGVVYEVG